jgi:hypothetical protein
LCTFVALPHGSLPRVLSRSTIALCRALESDLEFIPGRSITTTPCDGLRRERHGFSGFGYFSEIEYLARDRLLDAENHLLEVKKLAIRMFLLLMGNRICKVTDPIELIDVMMLGELYEDDGNDFTDYHRQAVKTFDLLHGLYDEDDAMRYFKKSWIMMCLSDG